MPREDIEFQTGDGITLRGWFYKPEASSSPLPVLVVSPGFSATKEMGLDLVAEHFISNLPISVLVFDYRNLGLSDNHPNIPRGEVIPQLQITDLQDAISYAQTRPDVNKDKVAIWGVSYSGGNVLWVAAIDKRVKAVISQIPIVSGWEIFHRATRPDLIPGVNQLFQEDRIARAAGKPAGLIPVSNPDPSVVAFLPQAEAYEWLGKYTHTPWKNQTTIRTLEAFRSYDPMSHIEHISPTPLLLTVQDDDRLAPTDLALAAYAKAREPKELHLLPGVHFDIYDKTFERAALRQEDFLKRTLLA